VHPNAILLKLGSFRKKIKINNNKKIPILTCSARIEPINTTAEINKIFGGRCKSSFSVFMPYSIKITPVENIIYKELKVCGLLYAKEDAPPITNNPIKINSIYFTKRSDKNLFLLIKSSIIFVVVTISFGYSLISTDLKKT